MLFEHIAFPDVSIVLSVDICSANLCLGIDCQNKDITCVEWVGKEWCPTNTFWRVLGTITQVDNKIWLLWSNLRMTCNLWLQDAVHSFKISILDPAIIALACDNKGIGLDSCFYMLSNGIEINLCFLISLIFSMFEFKSLSVDHSYA